ncbi:hypothetical protein MMC30_008970 [Trapelia coarctata]|nr:hypothetical protein [Trapelia coarctata]
MERRGTFDYILLETSGLADPGNIAPLFWVDDGLGSSIYLDGIVTLVDAKNVLRSLNNEPAEGASPEQGGHVTTAHLQISHSDVIVLNKSDTVTSDQLKVVRETVQGINGLARLHVTRYSRVSVLEGVILGLHAYDTVGFLEASEGGHSHVDPVSIPSRIGAQADTISTTTITVPRLSAKQLEGLEAWLRKMLWECTLALPGGEAASAPDSFSIHRLKGRLLLESGRVKMVQGVREVFEVTDLDVSKKGNVEPSSGFAEAVKGKLVLIGRGVAGQPWQDSLNAAIGSRTQ